MPTIVRQSIKAKPAANGSRSAWDMADRIRLLLFGASGSGKTVCWSSFPKPIKALICSGGRQPGELLSIPRNMRGQIEAPVIDSTERLLKELEDADDFQTVVLDHVSGLQSLDLMEVLGVSEIIPKLGWGTAEQKDWGTVNRNMIGYCLRLLNLPRNVVIVGQERVFAPKDKDAETAVPKVGVDVIPSFHNWLCPACDYIVQAYKASKIKEVTSKDGKVQRVRLPGVDYCLRTGEDDLVTTKFRVNTDCYKPPFLKVTTSREAPVSAYDLIQAVINGEYEEGQ